MLPPPETQVFRKGLPSPQPFLMNRQSTATAPWTVPEGDYPSSCPPNEQATEQAEVGTPGEQALKGIRRRWQQASLARATAPLGGVKLMETAAQQRQLELEGPAASTEARRGALKAAAAKHSAVKSKPAKHLRCYRASQRAWKACLNMAQRAQTTEARPVDTRAWSAWQKSPCLRVSRKILALRMIPKGQEQPCKTAPWSCPRRRG